MLLGLVHQDRDKSQAFTDPIVLYKQSDRNSNGTIDVGPLVLSVGILVLW